MTLRVEYKRYRRQFLKPLRTARGEWKVREGFLLRIEDSCNGGISFSEVAPIPEFGTETIKAADNFLRARAADSNLCCPDSLPCCQFALSVPLTGTTNRSFATADISALLPAGENAINILTAKQVAGHRNFKWKIGAFSLDDELRIAQQLFEQLSEGQQLRFDANASLSEDAFKRWLGVLQPHRDRVDYLEQPLPVGEEARMQSFGEAAGIDIALDESLNGLSGKQFLAMDEWSGVYVLKPLLAGGINHIREHLSNKSGRVVFSSAFETDVGVSNVFTLVEGSDKPIRPLGFDTRDAFEDSLVMSGSSSVRPLSSDEKEAMWNSI